MSIVISSTFPLHNFVRRYALYMRFLAQPVESCWSLQLSATRNLPGELTKKKHCLQKYCMTYVRALFRNTKTFEIYRVISNDQITFSEETTDKRAIRTKVAHDNLTRPCHTTRIFRSVLENFPGNIVPITKPNRRRPITPGCAAHNFLLPAQHSSIVS